MFRCIICLQVLIGAMRSREHVFAESMGGTWCIFDLCKPCNGQLGTNADAPLANDIFVKMARQRFEIHGKTGVPNAFERVAILERKHYRGHRRAMGRRLPLPAP